MTHEAAREETLTLASGLRLALRRHHPGAGPPLLAVHGWLDNAASFDALAACLPGHELVAVDLAGHGWSDHRPPGAWYHYVDYLDELVEVLDRLGWSRSHWLGHSLGGALLALLAAAMPERVDRLVLVESAGPLGGHADRAREQLRRGIDDRLRHRRHGGLRTFADPALAVAARRQANGLSEDAATALVARGLRAVDGGWQWSSDPRLTLASPFRLDEAHVQALLAAIACPALVLLADPPLPFMSADDRQARRRALAAARWQDFPGNHHLHMETPQPLATAISAFLSETST